MTHHLSKAEIKFINYQYLPGLTVKEPSKYLEASGARSARVRKKLKCSLDIQYGRALEQKLDVFPSPNKTSPVHIFIHGGYWRAKNVNKTIYSHIAGPLVGAGATVVLLDYALCPSVRISDIVKQIRDGVFWVYKNISKYNGNPKKLFLSGHSAGGHLAGMMMATDWSKYIDNTKALFCGFIFLSGLFDIEPHRHSSIQKDIRLTKKDTKNFSPMYLRPFSAAPSIVAVGGKESDLFHWQSLRYAAHLRLHGIKAHFVSTKDDNHFTITDRLGDSRSSLTKMFIRQMNLG